MPEFSFGDRELGSCQRLVYASRIATASDASGGHRVRRTGEGVDFLDYRRYVPGVQSKQGERIYKPRDYHQVAG